MNAIDTASYRWGAIIAVLVPSRCNVLFVNFASWEREHRWEERANVCNIVRFSVRKMYAVRRYLATLEYLMPQHDLGIGNVS